MNNNLRLKIIEYVSSNNYGKESIDELAKSLNIDALSFSTFVKVINELDDEGELYITNKGFIHYSKKVRIYVGKVKIIRKYCGIIELKDGTNITVENNLLMNAYKEDIVRVHVNLDLTGEVIQVLSHHMWNVIATYKNHSFIVEEKNFYFDLKVKNEKNKFHLVEGNIVELKILQYEGMCLNCEIKRIIGHKNDPGMDILKCILNHQVRYEFDNKLLDYTNKLITKKEQITQEELKNRKNFCDELIVTIDGLDAKDLDDAISLKINENGNYLLGVHIADVSYYVTKDSIIDKEAFTRGTSIYLADRVIPMLPHSLCNGVCSLNENQLRLTMSCLMELNENGEVIDYEITPSYIISKKRLDYDDVNHLFKKEPTRLEYEKNLKEMLFLMLRLSHILSKKMEEDGYISLNIDEAKLIIDEKSNQVIDIKKRNSGEAEKLIENFMILANETVASHVYYMQLPFIYRVHDKISQEKSLFLIEKLKEMNINLNAHQTSISPKKIQEILKKVKNTPYEFVANQVVLRSMSKACYSVENIGHFGLGSKCYTHFTSPIRRYPDLIVHRFLKKYLVDGDFSDETSFLIQASDNSSVLERKAISLEREVEDIKKAQYMQNYIGCVFDGVISGIVDFGVFVQLENTVEGLMRYESMYNNYDYRYQSCQFKVGQEIKIRVESVNITSGEVNFTYVQQKFGGKKHVKTHYK